MAMIDKLLGMDMDEYDQVSHGILKSLRIVPMPLVIKEEIFFAFGILAEKCRIKDKEIAKLQQQLGELTEKSGD